MMKLPIPFADRLLSFAHFLGLGVGIAKPRAPEQGTRGVPDRAVREAARTAAALPPAPFPPVPAARPAPAAVQRSSPPAARLDEDPDEEMRGGSPAAAARMRERARCAAIVMSDIGLKHPQIAYALAFHTTQSAAEALAVLDDIGAGTFAHLAEKGPQGGASRYRTGAPH
jgi:hypothetical protein